MNQRIQNQLNMVGACLNVAQSRDYKSVWDGQPPADFGTDMAKAQTDYDAVVAKAVLADGATGGAADAKATAETALEDAYLVARALASHFKKTGDLDRLGRVDVSKSAIMKLRTQELVNRTTGIRDLAATAAAEPGAEGRGITTARVATVTAAIAAYSKVMNSPRSQIVNRSALLKEVETDAAALVEFVGGMDDLVMQFDGTEAGKRFIEAWKRARMIMEIGGGHGGNGGNGNGGGTAVTPAAPAAPVLAATTGN
jgi:hypothetical protein